MKRASTPYAERGEAQLVLAAAGRDQRAFAELVGRRQAWLRALLRRMTGDYALAEDLAQEAFMRAWDYLPRLAVPNAFAAWLRRIAVSLFLQQARKKGVALEAMPEEPVFIDGAPSVEATSAARLDLERALAVLSSPERFCVTLSYGEGLSHAEIAELAQLPLGTVKSHIARGGAKMRAALASPDRGGACGPSYDA